jgi:hypothetical protein
MKRKILHREFDTRFSKSISPSHSHAAAASSIVDIVGFVDEHIMSIASSVSIRTARSDHVSKYRTPHCFPAP